MSSPPAFAPGDGLLLVDPQNDFCPGGSLAVADGDAVMPVLSAWADAAERAGIPIFTSRDWHPAKTTHFQEYGGVWPPHCVMGTPGADFLPGLCTERFHAVWRKGYDRDFEAYAVTAQHPGFPGLLRDSGISNVVVCGIATNICCFYAARDLRRAGFRVLLVEDASAGIDVPAAGLYQEAARAEGRQLGIEYVSLAALEAAVR